MAKPLIGCSGWNYQDKAEDGGWVGSFYPDTQTKRLSYYSQFFATAELDATFYERFYSKMTSGTFIGMVKATPDNFQFSVKAPETITHIKRMRKEALADLSEFLAKISPLKNANKLGAILLQLPPSFSVNEFKKVEAFLDRLPSGYQYALEFRHPSWQTEGPWEMLKHYNVAAVMTDSPDAALQYLSDITVTADHSFIRFHGRNKGIWYNYLYSKEELEPWVPKVNEIKKKTKMLRIYFNNHYRAGAIFDALLFAEMLGEKLTPEQENVKNRVKTVLAGIKSQRKMQEYADTPSPSSAS